MYSKYQNKIPARSFSNRGPKRVGIPFLAMEIQINREFPIPGPTRLCTVFFQSNGLIEEKYICQSTTCMIVTLVHAGEILDIATEKPIQLKPYAWHEYFTPPLVEDPKTENNE